MSDQESPAAAARRHLWSDPDRSIRASIDVLRPFLASAGRRRLAVLGLTSFFGGLAEAAVVVIVVATATKVADTDGALGADLPIVGSLDLSVPAYLAIGLGLLVFRLAVQLYGAHLSARVATDASTDIRKRVHRSFLRASWDLQSREEEGHLQDLVTSHTSQVGNSLLTLANGLSALTNLAALGASAVIVDPPAAIAVLVAVVVLFFIFRPAGSITRRYSADQASTNITYVQNVAQDVRMAQEIRTFGVTERLASVADDLADAHAHPSFLKLRLRAAVGPMYQSLVLGALLIGLGAINAFAGGELASLGAIVLILLRALNNAQQLQRVYQSLNEGVPFAQALEARIDAYTSTAAEPATTPLEAIERLELRSVSYAYEQERPVLTDIDLTVERGQAIGIIGPSGAGKSTLVQVLLRLRPPTSGEYLVNGRAAADYFAEDWYRQVTFVPQDPKLAAGTVRDNIVFNREGITDDDIERAARQAHLHEEILTWADGYDTQVGGQNAAISGGQRQRLCIARALVTEPDVVVLDEPTSALDVDTETILRQTLEALGGRATIFIVAHRMSTLRMCDRFLVLEDGRVAAFAPASELAEREGFFRRALDDTE